MISLIKVSTNEGLAIERREQAEKAEKLAKDLQGRLGIQMGIINTLHEDKQQLSRYSICKINSVFFVFVLISTLTHQNKNNKLIT